MTLARRSFLAMGGGAVAALSWPTVVTATDVITIEMQGTPRGERIWFAPRGLAVNAGTTIRFINKDPVNSHTATAYHPEIYGRKRRIPQAADPWDSDFLLPGESFDVRLSVPGVYDYYCIPHEMAAMVGRIIVGAPDDPLWEGPSRDEQDVSAEVHAALPNVDDILALGRVEEASEK